MPRLLEKYRKEIVPQMMAEFGYKTVMAIPRIDKVVINVGTGRFHKEDKFIEKVTNDLAKLSGQRPSHRKSRQSIAGFKVREGATVGVATTLRGKRMYDFIDRLVSIALPRTRDFRGLDTKSFDNQGNFSIGIKEHNIFPEIKYETLKDIFGMQVTITTTAKDKKEGLKLLKLFGFPLK